MLTIGIEGQRLYRKKKHGMDMVALELIKNLQILDTVNNYIIFVKPDEDKTCIPEAPNFTIVELVSKYGYPGWEQSVLPKAALAHKCDILHCTSNTGPLYSKVPLVITLHDIIYLEKVSLLTKGGTWYQKLGNMYRRFIVPPVIKKSKKVITVSNYEKHRINAYFKLPENRLTAIYNGVGSHFKKIQDQQLLTTIKQKYRLPDKFLFFLGNTDPKKNTKGVLKAFADFNKKYPDEYKLVMLDFDKDKLSQLLQEISAPEICHLIQLTGYVVNTELPAIINQCSVFLYPSLRESFGIPILEGMACGVPVITSNTSSMPEIVGAGKAALIVDPFKPEEITEAICKIIEDKALAEQLGAKGIVRAKEFSWKIMAQHVLNLYNEVYQELN